MFGRFNWIPGANSLQQAWDATKLIGVIMKKNAERALVLSQNKAGVERYQNEKATMRMKELFEEKNYGEVVRLFVPDAVCSLALDFNDFWWKVWDMYWIFVALRILLVFLPQYGYIHPDEFFQSVEVVTGDVFTLDVVRTWEFNATSPIRSMTVPVTLFGLPLYIYQGLDWLVHFHTGWTIISSYLVFLIPRLVMLTMSFIVDYCVYKVCILYKHSFNQCLTTLASSYVMVIYSTRTFSNTIEMVLTAVLVYLVAHCMKRTSETVHLLSLIKEAHDEAETIREKVQITKKKRLIPEHDFKYFLPISIICAIGFFNRPTFAAFAFIPLFFWFQRGVAVFSHFTPFQMFNFRMFALIPGVLITSLSIIFFDSLYYGDLTLKKIWNMKMDWTDFKCTPLQFLMYNVVPGNLEQHGSHPWYMHSLLNLQLLFGPLGIAGILSFLNFLAEIVSHEWAQKPGVRTVYAMCLGSFVVPLAILSLFPHQEPRFLIPIIIPLVLTNAHKLRFKICGRKPFLMLWYVFNILAIIFFGFVHQGGVYPAVKFIGNNLKFHPDTREANFVFSNTYMPPKFPLLQPKEQFDDRPYLNNPNVHIQFLDMAGKDLDSVKTRVLALASRADMPQYKGRVENYIVLPSFLIDDLSDRIGNVVTFRRVFYHFPHISTECLPAARMDFLDFINTEDLTFSPTLMVGSVLERLSDFGLAIYRIHLGDVHTIEVKPNRSKSL